MYVTRYQHIAIVGLWIVATAMGSCAPQTGGSPRTLRSVRDSVSLAVSISDDTTGLHTREWRPERGAQQSLHAGATSIDDLVMRALSAFASRDTSRLQSLLITQNEFEHIVYPELGLHYPSARDARNETRVFLWEQQHLSARKGLYKALRDVGGKRMEQLDVRFADSAKRFLTYRLHEGTEVVVRMPDGSPATLFALGSIIERQGRFKLLSYRDID